MRVFHFISFHVYLTNRLASQNTIEKDKLRKQHNQTRKCRDVRMTHKVWLTVQTEETVACNCLALASVQFVRVKASALCVTLMSLLTRKIRAMICLHNSSEIIARTQNFSSCGFYLASTIFNASYSFHVYLIELIFDVDCRS